MSTMHLAGNADLTHPPLEVTLFSTDLSGIRSAASAIYALHALTPENFEQLFRTVRYFASLLMVETKSEAAYDYEWHDRHLVEALTTFVDHHSTLADVNGEYDYANILWFLRIHTAAHQARHYAQVGDFAWAQIFYERCFAIIATAGPYYQTHTIPADFGPPSPNEMQAVLGHLLLAEGKIEEAATILENVCLCETTHPIRSQERALELFCRRSLYTAYDQLVQVSTNEELAQCAMQNRERLLSLFDGEPLPRLANEFLWFHATDRQERATQ